MKHLFAILAVPACLTLAVEAQTPYPTGNVKDLRPKVGCKFSGPMRNLRLFMDGKELTAQSLRASQSIEYVPAANLNFGHHECWAFGLNLLGLKVEKRWSFDTVQQQQGLPPASLQTLPQNGATVDQVRPQIQGTAPQNILAARVYLDGQEVTRQVSLQGNRFEFQPGSDLSSGEHQVGANLSLANGQSLSHNWKFKVRAQQAQGSNHPQGGSNLFSNPSPPPNSRFRHRRPTFALDYSVQMQGLKMIIDQVDFTSSCQVTGNRISFTPDYDVDFGSHQILVEGTLANGQRVNRYWGFDIDGNAAQEFPQSGNGNQGEFRVRTPKPGGEVPATFDVKGSAPAGSNVKVEIRPRNSNRTYTYLGQADSKGRFSVYCPATWSSRGQRLRLRVVRTDGAGPEVGAPEQFEVIRR